MKLNINKACDLNSISVLPPHNRRTNAMLSGTDSSVLGRSQVSQFRSQSQQSFSQGMSLSQLSQNSLEEIITNEQRYGSQDKDNSIKRISCLAPVNYSREESQQIIASRPSNSIMGRWNPGFQEHRCQVSQELEHRIGLMETSLNKLGMVLDSIQSDVMQVIKSLKEVSLEKEGIQQKMNAYDSSLKLVLKVEEEIKEILSGSLKSIPVLLKKELDHKLQDIVSGITSLPDRISVSVSKIQQKFLESIKNKEATKERQYSTTNLPHTIHSMKPLTNSEKQISNRSTPTLQPGKRNRTTQFQTLQPPKFTRSVVPLKRIPVPKKESENFRLSKPASRIISQKNHKMSIKEEEKILQEKEQNWNITIESDEDMDNGFSCLLHVKETGCMVELMAEAEEETMRILRKARRRKRRQSNAIIIVD